MCSMYCMLMFNYDGKQQSGMEGNLEHVREEPVWGRMGGLVIKITVPSDRGLEVGCVTVGDYSLLLLKLWVSAL